MVRAELAALWRCVVDRPKWQLPLVVLVSAWTLALVIGQMVARVPPSPLDLPRGVLAWAGIPTGWLDPVSGWLRQPDRATVLVALSVFGGLLWASTTERAQLPALFGWLAVLVAVEGIGYQPAVLGAVLSMVGVIAVLTVLSLPGRANPLRMDRVLLLPRNVLRTGVTAAALSAMVPLFLPVLALVRLVRPYTTRPAARPSIPMARSGVSERVGGRVGVEERPPAAR